MSDAGLQEVLARISSQTEAAYAGGALPEGYEAALDAGFVAVAADMASLTRGVESGELSARQEFSFGADFEAAAGDPVTPAQRGAGTARALAHRGLSKARRMAGPKLRAAERRSIERAGQAAESAVTRAHVLADTARRLTSAGPVSRRIARVSPSERARPQTGESIRGESSFAGGSWQLEDWVFERLKQAPGAPVLHAECGDGDFVRRLAANGYAASGADPSASNGSPSIQRLGALEAVGRTGRTSLGGLVLSGVTDRVNAARARSIAHLAARHLRSGGVVIVVSAHPEHAPTADVVASELSELRALHPVTWCHLLGRYGFGQITVQEADSNGYYGVSAVKQ